MMSKLQTVFFGSGPVALESLRQLADLLDIEAIVTKPATEAEMKAAFPATPVYTVQSRTELDALMKDRRFTSQLGLLIDFGIIVSQAVIDSFPLGIVNSHFSLLPEWRGADPITCSILSGQKQTGVSLMLVTAGLDEGPLLAQAPFDITDDATSAGLTENLIELSSALLREVLPAYVTGKIQPVAQAEASLYSGQPTYSRKLTKADGRLDWGKPAQVLERQIRAYGQWPQSYTTLGGKDVIITAAHAVPLDSGDAPGHIEIIAKDGVLQVTTGEGCLHLDRLKPAGKGEMTARAFLAGYGRLFKT